MEKEQALQQQLQAVLIQKESIKAQIFEIENTIKELEKIEDENVFKIVGNIMVSKKRDEVIDELKESLENIKLRLNAIERIEAKLNEEISKEKEK